MGDAVRRPSWSTGCCRLTTRSPSRCWSGRYSATRVTWMETKRSRKDRSVLLNRALDLMDEMQHAMRRLDELR